MSDDLKERLIKANFDLKNKVSITVPFALEIGEYCKKQGALGVWREVFGLVHKLTSDIEGYDDRNKSILLEEEILDKIKKLEEANKK